MTKSTGAGRHPPSQRTHGHSYVNGLATPEYRAWSSMKRRCLNPSCKQYPRYGGRGILVCAEWVRSFEQFLADLGPRPSKQHSLDRRDNNGNYCKSNCRWGTVKEQQRNKASNRSVEFNGEVLTLAALSEKSGVPYYKLRNRIDRGWSVERAAT